MIGRVVRNGTNQIESVRHLSMHRKMLAQVHAGDGGLDRRELSTNFSRSLGLWIVRIDMASAPLQPDKDYRRIDLRLSRCRIRRPDSQQVT